MNLDKVKSLIYGHAIADALGVPVEYVSREDLKKAPVTDMQGFGTYNLQPGTWSDDTSLTLALMESISRNGKLNYEDIMKNFLNFEENDEFTYDGMFDIGQSTSNALKRFSEGNLPMFCGGFNEMDNGNGSLMRISPMIFYLDDKYSDVFFADRTIGYVHNVSSLTHGHNRSKIACGIYVMIGHEILHSSGSLQKDIESGLEKAREFYSRPGHDDYTNELETHYSRLMQKDFKDLPESEINSSGYVVYSLEACLWCLLNTNDYKSAVLKAVNLGDDADTIGAITGGLAGLFYGFDSIPKEWYDILLGKSSIDYISEEFASKTYKV